MEGAFPVTNLSAMRGIGALGGTCRLPSPAEHRIFSYLRLKGCSSYDLFLDISEPPRYIEPLVRE